MQAHNDFAAGVRKSYLGLNNLKVGRIAASMIGLAAHKPGKVAVFVGGYRWHGHELREAGRRCGKNRIARLMRALGISQPPPSDDAPPRPVGGKRAAR